MSKPLKFYQSINQAPRSAKHGQHRRSRAPFHGYTAIGTDYSSGRADEDRTGVTFISWSTVGNSWSWSAPEPAPPAIPYAGIRTGELIGHRLWWVIEEAGESLLCSLAHRRLWLPGETIYGDPSKPVHSEVFYTIWGGTYAFASVGPLLFEIEQHQDIIRQSRHGLIWGMGWLPYNETATLVSGTIKMWGEVVEHEHGYRAEYAKLNSIDEIFGAGDLDMLRVKYGVK